MKIEGINLAEDSIGSKVTYLPNHVDGDASHPDCEGGTISSWNAYYIFVDYGKGTCAATRSENLVWG